MFAKELLARNLTKSNMEVSFPMKLIGSFFKGIYLGIVIWMEFIGMLVLTEKTQPVKYREDIDFIRQLLSDMLEQQSNPRLNSNQVLQCKKGIKALRSAIDALECQIVA